MTDLYIKLLEEKNRELRDEVKHQQAFVERAKVLLPKPRTRPTC